MRLLSRLMLWQHMLIAHRAAKSGDFRRATATFALARELAVSQANPSALSTALSENWQTRVDERKAYRDILAARGTGGQRVLILDASSGLPRPDRMDTPHKGAEVTYPWLLGEAVQPVLCSQRNITTADALDLLDADETLAHCDAAVIHLGLNDCANRIFSHRERVALSLLPTRLRYRIVGFAQTYRRDILRLLPARHYVELADFQRNLDLIIARLRAGGTKAIILTTIITPPSPRWAATPGVNLNFARYNQEILRAASRNGVTFFELDRMVLEGGQADLLIADGIHMSDAGNALFAQKLQGLLTAR